VFPDLLIGSVGSAYNLKALEDEGVTHILTCAANIKPRFPDVSFEAVTIFFRNSLTKYWAFWILPTKVS